MITPAEAVKAAVASIESYRLDRNPTVANIISQGRPEEPLLVRRLDASGKDYYLVPWSTDEGVALVAQVAAFDGLLQGFSQLPRPAAHLFINSREALDVAHRQLPHARFGKQQLVWQPCQESTSPLRPLYQIPYKQNSVYVSMDGRLFPKLTPLQMGG